MRTATTSAATTIDRSDRMRVDQHDELVMVMLQDHVPLSLLIDLTDPSGPVSAEILLEEGGPETRWWER